jgi:hypothetical protein
VTCVHMTIVICFCRGFGIRSFKVYHSLVTGVPDFLMNFKHRWTYFLAGLTPMADLYHVSPNMNGPDLVAKSWIAIPCDKISMCSRTPILRSPMLVGIDSTTSLSPRRPFGHRDIVIPDATISMSPESTKCRTPTPLGSSDACPPEIHDYDFFGVSRLTRSRFS